MRQLLSARSTPFFRNVFPVLWLLVAGTGSVLMWLPGPPDPPLIQKILFPFAWLAVGVLLFRAMRRFRTVWLDGDTLVVGAGAEEWLIPLSAVEEVSRGRGRNRRSVRISARGPTGELVHVDFIAPTMLHRPFSEHPVATLLRERVDAARTALPQGR